MCSLDSNSGGGGGWGGALELHVPFWQNFSWEIQMQQNRREKFFINNSAEVLIPF